MMPTVTPGITRLLGPDRQLIAGRCVGVVCNPASIDAQFRLASDLLHDDPEVSLKAPSTGSGPTCRTT